MMGNEVKPILMGRHLVESGSKPGKHFGSILKQALDAQVNGEFEDLEGAITMKLGLIFGAVAGSRLYGTNREDSDWDIRGVCFPPINSLLGLTGFEQYTPSGILAERYSMANFGIVSDDVTIYSLSKFFKLCLNSNPNIIELLFCDKGLIGSETWEMIIQNRHLFLSQKAIHSFSGYAYSQLMRIKRHKVWIDNPPVKPDPLDFSAFVAEGRPSKWKNSEAKSRYGKRLKNFQSYKTWQKNRNPSRHLLEDKYGFDTKHASHLYRLFFEARELLSDGKITLPLKDEYLHQVLSVLHGEVDYNDVLLTADTMSNELKSMDTTLPKRPDASGAEKLLIKLQSDYIKRGFVL